MEEPSTKTVPLFKAVGVLQALQRQQEAARRVLQAVRQEHATLSVAVAELRTRQAVLEAGVAQSERQAEQWRGLQEETTALARAVRAEVEGDLARRRAEGEGLGAQVEALRQRLAALREEAHGLEAACAQRRAEVEVLRREREALDAARGHAAEVRALAEREALEARIAAENLERWRAEAQSGLAETQGLLEQVTGEVEHLRGEKRALERAFRPLLPYRPPAQRLRLATAEVQVNSKLQQHDATALRLYAEQTGTEMKRILMEALRNYLPTEVYAAALDLLQEQGRQGLQPHAETATPRVPPGGPGAATRRRVE